MKKYVKPALFMERFEMAEHIALCGANHNPDYEGSITVNNHYAESCSIDMDMFGDGTFVKNIFVSSACDNQWMGDDSFNFCYQGITATADSTLFFS